MDQLQIISNWSQGHIEHILFYVLAILSVPLAVGVIMDGVIIRAGFILIGVFGIVSGLFLLLEAQFLALAQVMIYAVGITLVVVIALMLTNPRLESELSPQSTKQSVAGFIVSLMIFLAIYQSLRSADWTHINNKPEIAATDNVKLIGDHLCTTYCLPFEFSSILLLAALVGSVMLAKKDSAGTADELAEENELEQTPEQLAAMRKENQSSSAAGASR